MGHEETNPSPVFDPVAGRLFVAIRPPGYVIDAIESLRREEEGATGLSWVPPEKLHLTLAFLGEVAFERQREIAGRLAEVYVRPFFLALEGLGVFPRKGRPRVLWAGFAPVDPLLFQLHGKIERIMFDLGFEPERRRYDPHVTIARCGSAAGPAVATMVKKHRDFGTAPFQVHGIGLHASRPGPGGSVYTEIMRVTF